MKIQSKIRFVAARKSVVFITSRRKNKDGFVVENPDGHETFHPTKREALQAMLAQVRCSKSYRWTLRTEGGR